MACKQIMCIIKKCILIIPFLPMLLCRTAFAAGLELSPQRGEEVREHIERILSSSDFTKKVQDTSFVSSMGKAIQDLLLWLKSMAGQIRLPNFGSLHPIVGAGQGVVMILEIVGILILILLLGVIGYFIFKNIKISRGMRNETDEEYLTVLRDPDLMEKMAFDALGDRDFKQALRFLYLAFLLRMNELNIVHIDKAKTNKQYLKEIRSNRALLFKSASELTALFNSGWYGEKELAAERIEAWFKQYPEMIKEAEK